MSRGWDAWVSTVSVKERSAFIRVLLEAAQEVSDETSRETVTIPARRRRLSGPRGQATPNAITDVVTTNRKDVEMWVGGYFGPRSFAGSPPNHSDLFLEWAYDMEEDGTFGERLDYGLYIPGDKIKRLEVLYPRLKEN